MPERNEILDEIRAVRDAIAAAGGYDIERIAATLREHETAGSRPLLTLSPRRPTVSRMEPVGAPGGAATHASE